MKIAILGKRLYIDANVIIYAIEDFPEFSPGARVLFDAIDRKLVVPVTSHLTLPETLVRPLRLGQTENVQIYDDLLSDSGHFEFVPLTRAILRNSAEIRARVGGKLPDAIHAACALSAKCDYIVTGETKMKLPPELPYLNVRDFAE